MEVNIHEAKTRLSNLIERALNGEDVVIAKAGKPVVRLVAVKKYPKRVFGSAAGTIEFFDGWEAPLSDTEFERFISE